MGAIYEAYFYAKIDIRISHDMLYKNSIMLYMDYISRIVFGFRIHIFIIFFKELGIGHKA